jgi:hypothetical protein
LLAVGALFIAPASPPHRSCRVSVEHSRSPIARNIHFIRVPLIVAKPGWGGIPLEAMQTTVVGASIRRRRTWVVSRRDGAGPPCSPAALRRRAPRRTERCSRRAGARMRFDSTGPPLARAQALSEELDPGPDYSTPDLAYD